MRLHKADDPSVLPPTHSDAHAEPNTPRPRHSGTRFRSAQLVTQQRRWRASNVNSHLCRSRDAKSGRQ